MTKPRYLFVVLLLVLSLACSFGSKTTPTEAPTTAATTAATTPASSGEVAQAQPTMTPAPPVESGGCTLNAAYVADVTIPDNTVLQPGASFSKAWRMRNSGTCDWEPGTQLVFVSGEPMTAIGAVPVPAVAAGAMTDISIDMTAPTAPGTYKSVWQLQSPSGQRFGNKVYVQIIVPAPPTSTPVPPTSAPPTPTPGLTIPPITLIPTLIPPPITLIPTLPPPVIAEDFAPSSRGQVESNGQINHGVSNCGDTSINTGLEAFVTYDLSSLPANATILGVYLYWPNGYDTLGTPFVDLGCMRVYQQDYGTLDAGDYVHPPVMGALSVYCSSGNIDNASSTPLDSSLNSVVQNRAGNGMLQLRLQFNETETNGDGEADVFRGEPHLLISYQP